MNHILYVEMCPTIENIYIKQHIVYIKIFQNVIGFGLDFSDFLFQFLPLM